MTPTGTTHTDLTVAIYGAGQLGRAVAERLARRAGITLLGPAARAPELLTSGADVVVIATTTRLTDVTADIRSAVRAGSNVVVSAEEAAYPWAVDDGIAGELDALAREQGVTVLGAGVNPGLIFDGLVLTLLGSTSGANTIRVRRTVDISRFGSVVLGRLGVGYTADRFRRGVDRGDILGHAGFPQSMAIVADALGQTIERIDRTVEPIFAEAAIALPQRTVAVGESAGVRQVYTAVVGGRAWYTASFTGHVDPSSVGLVARDEIEIDADTTVSCTLAPGIGAQAGSAAMVANSIDRVVSAEPGWRTVADLPPAFPRIDPIRSFQRTAAPTRLESAQ
jgi:4-hydroxy-tetrahydrodipicolinate reductase